jgi:uncharacterized membrane protein YagU involved in acid resistance
MKSKIAPTVIAGLIATAVMTVVGLMAPYMGLPRMNPAELLSGMMNVSLVIGYLMHCMIGIIFAAAYVYIFNPKVHIHSKLFKGLVFGFSVFVFAQIMMLIMGMRLPMPEMKGDKMLMMIGSVIGHLVSGVVVALIVPNYSVAAPKNIKTAHA